MNRTATTALKIILPVVVLVAAAAGARALTGLRADPETRPPETIAPLVRVAEVTLDDVRLTVRSQGTVQPRSESLIAAEVSGRVIWISPDLVAGGSIDAGQALLRIEAHDYEQAVVRARADIAERKLRLAQEEAEAEIARKEWEALGQGAASDLTLRVPQVANAHAALAAAEANLVQAERNLARTELRSPYAARVRSETVDVGQFVAQGSTLASIYATDFAEVHLPLPDAELAYLSGVPLGFDDETRRGPAVTLRAEFAGAIHEWQGRIVRTDGQIDPSSRMVNLIAEVPRPYARVAGSSRPPFAVGMFVEAEIQGSLLEGVAVIPRAALRDNDIVVTVDSQGALRSRQVEIARVMRETVIVRAGLADGERVVLSSLGGAGDGTVVRIQADQVHG